MPADIVVFVPPCIHWRTVIRAPTGIGRLWSDWQHWRTRQLIVLTEALIGRVTLPVHQNTCRSSRRTVSVRRRGRTWTQICYNTQQLVDASVYDVSGRWVKIRHMRYDCLTTHCNISRVLSVSLLYASISLHLYCERRPSTTDGWRIRQVVASHLVCHAHFISPSGYIAQL